MFSLRVPLLLILLTSAHAGYAQEAKPKSQPPSPGKVLIIKDLLVITGTANLANQVIAQMIQSYKQTFTDVPEAVWERLQKKMNAEEMIDSLVEIYDRHFSLEDLQLIVSFYKTPAGQRMIKELPSVMTEAMAVGKEWGQKKGAELFEEIKAEQNAAKKSDNK